MLILRLTSPDNFPYTVIHCDHSDEWWSMQSMVFEASFFLTHGGVFLVGDPSL